MELASVVSGVARSRSLLSLNISKNLSKIKARDVVHVMEAIVQLIQVSVGTKLESNSGQLMKAQVGRDLKLVSNHISSWIKSRTLLRGIEASQG